MGKRVTGLTAEELNEILVCANEEMKLIGVSNKERIETLNIMIDGAKPIKFNS